MVQQTMCQSRALCSKVAAHTLHCDSEGVCGDRRPFTVGLAKTKGDFRAAIASVISRDANAEGNYMCMPIFDR